MKLIARMSFGSCKKGDKYSVDYDEVHDQYIIHTLDGIPNGVLKNEEEISTYFYTNTLSPSKLQKNKVYFKYHNHFRIKVLRYIDVGTKWYDKQQYIFEDVNSNEKSKLFETELRLYSDFGVLLEKIRDDAMKEFDERVDEVRERFVNDIIGDLISNITSDNITEVSEDNK